MLNMDCTYHPHQPPLPQDQRSSYPSNPAASCSSHDGLKPHSTHATFKWLEKNYQLEDGVCLPRCTIYEHYQSYCDRQRLQPVNAASFGKIVRQHFPTLTTRRLGTRGQSKYHYYGLGIKPTSEYYPPDYVDKVKQGNQKKTSEAKKTTTQEKPSTVLPVFPDVNNLMLSNSIPIEKLKTFMVMYRAHCQRILDSVVRANFNEVENFLLHFWQGMPNHMLPVLSSEVVIDLVAYCDTLLYKVICNVLITSPLQNLPESLAGEYRLFSDMLRQWMEVALKGLPESLQEAKYKVAEGFINGLRRQTSLTKLAQVAQSELRNSNSLEQLRQDWECVDLQAVYAQTLYSIQPMKIPTKYCNLLPDFLQRFSNLLHEETGLEQFLSFAERMVHDAIEKGMEEKSTFHLKDACQAFLLSWKFFNTKILEEFTMENAPSFGFFILLHMLLDDYITHLLETRLEKEEEKIYYRRIHTLKKNDTQLSSSSVRNNSSSNSSSPLQSPDEEMPDTFNTAAISLPPPPLPAPHSASSSHVSIKHLEGFQSGTAPMNSLFSNLAGSFMNNESTTPPAASSASLGPGAPLSMITSMPNKHNSFFPSITSSTHNLAPPLGGGGGGSGSRSGSVSSSQVQQHQKIAPPTNQDFTTPLNSYPTLPPNHHGDTHANRTASSLTGYQQPLHQQPQQQPPSAITSPLSGSMRSPRDHLSPPVNFSGSQTNLYSGTPVPAAVPSSQQPTNSQQQNHEQPQQSSLMQQLAPQQQSLLPTMKSNMAAACSSSTSFNVYSLSSTTPTFITQSSHANLAGGTAPTVSGSGQMPPLPSCSLPISNPTQTFPTSPVQHQQQHFTANTGGAGQHSQLTPPAPTLSQHIAMTTPGPVAAVSDLTNTQPSPHVPLPSNMAATGRPLSSLTGFPALNVPYSHPNSTTTLSAGTNSLSIFPTGMYPYTQFVGIPTQLNNPFNPTSLQMHGTQNQMPSGYPYLANVPHSLYNPQISTTAYSR